MWPVETKLIDAPAGNLWRFSGRNDGRLHFPDGRTRMVNRPDGILKEVVGLIQDAAEDDWVFNTLLERRDNDGAGELCVVLTHPFRTALSEDSNFKSRSPILNLELLSGASWSGNCNEYTTLYRDLNDLLLGTNRYVYQVLPGFNRITLLEERRLLGRRTSIVRKQFYQTGVGIIDIGIASIPAGIEELDEEIAEAQMNEDILEVRRLQEEREELSVNLVTEPKKLFTTEK